MPWEYEHERYPMAADTAVAVAAQIPIFRSSVAFSGLVQDPRGMPTTAVRR